MEEVSRSNLIPRNQNRNCNLHNGSQRRGKTVYLNILKWYFLLVKISGSLDESAYFAFIYFEFKVADTQLISQNCCWFYNRKFKFINNFQRNVLAEILRGLWKFKIVLKNLIFMCEQHVVEMSFKMQRLKDML